ncbi:MAG: IS21 family transposase [Thermomonas sp.]|uniref:IS21 family transposase n=1 Tax=Thermomonas sp. TaxID=1971895 RepID=UPI0039E44EE9
MRKLKELCRWILRTDLSNRKIAEQLRCSSTTVGRYREILAEQGWDWPQIDSMDELALARKLNPSRYVSRKVFLEPDWSYIHREYQRPGVTLLLLHEEYACNLGERAMSETEFRRRYHRYARTRGLVMRQVRPPGQDLFLDFSGVRPYITDPATGKKQAVELFVAVMGASRKTFVYAVQSQKLPDWIDSNAQALRFFGGVPMYLVPDNLKAAVTRRTREDGPLINATYMEFASHYDTDIMPAGPRKPKHKAPVEIGVQLAQRWILARLRNRTFFSLDELNLAIAELTELLNNKPMRGCGDKSRNQLFEELDAPALRPLPNSAYEFAEWKLNITVGQDYHVAWHQHYYSVHHALVGRKVDLRAAARQVSIYLQGKRVATHQRDDTPGGFSTLEEHMPPAHRAYGRDSYETIAAWASQQRGAIATFFEQHVTHYGSAGRSFQAGRGLRALARQYGVDRLQAACARALIMNARSISSVKSMLKRGIECTELHGHEAANDDPIAHENVRGSGYYERE